MKKFLSLLLTAVLCCSLGITAFAAEGDYTFSVQTEGSPAVGDTITVTLELSKNGAEEFDLYAMQDYVRFDPAYFSYVDQSLKVYTVKTGELERKIFSASPLDFDEDGVIDRIFVNRASTDAERIASGTQVMQFQLRVKAQGNTTLTQSGVEIFQDPSNPDSYHASNLNIAIRGAGGTGDSTGGSTGGSSGGSSSGGGGGSSSTTPTKPETATKPDGTKVETVTKPDGTTVKTETKKDGSVSKTETKKDGSSVTENKAADGSTGTVKTDRNGQTTAETTLSGKAVEDAKKSGEAVKAPVEVEATRNSNTAPTVKVELPKGAGETKVEIPVSNVKSGTVAVLVHADGTEEIVKNSIPTETGIRLTVDGSATVKIIDNSKGFIDTRNHWAEDEIDFVSARGLVNGMSATIYAPNNSTTRAQLWTILARQADANLNGGSTWYEKAQNWAKTKGVSDGANPNDTITRAQMVTMLWRAKGQPAAGSTASFTDVPADAYYASAVSWAVEHGITTGVGNGKFNPNGTCTRAQIAAFLMRLYAEK